MRRTAITAGAVVCLTAVAAWNASTASAATYSARSATSSKGGYGTASVVVQSGTGGTTATVTVCDNGAPDGLRAVAYLGGGEPVHAAGGSGSCNTASYRIVFNGNYPLQVALRNGATGSDVYHGTPVDVYIHP
ncbi:hypothetical protein GCM10010207_82640 [Streptomyces atratus]|nr:hypothetical protein GCM10010207_82640 [Streptomyces atratus]